MSKNQLMCNNEKILFRNSVSGISKIVQDTIFHVCDYKKKFVLDTIKRRQIEQEIHSYFFKSQSSSFVVSKNPESYIKDNIYLDKLKKLRSGKYLPEIFLDLHGLTRKQAKRELGHLIFLCCKEKLSCASVIHGHGKNILKQQIPLWLANHPDIIAFHRAPKIFGSSASILILVQQCK
ncbi:endonuclease SmrB [Buchnera aphidicola (Hormaphis cornu)]|nr:endonuclease SmrB [Buchnera aphidicola (Hormaphis cornu)]